MPHVKRTQTQHSSWRHESGDKLFSRFVFQLFWTKSTTYLTQSAAIFVRADMDNTQSERYINEANKKARLIKSSPIHPKFLIPLPMPATRHSDARKEFYGIMTHSDAQYMRPGSQSHRHGERRGAARFGRATQSSGGRIDHDVSHVNFKFFF